MTTSSSSKRCLKAAGSYSESPDGLKMTEISEDVKDFQFSKFCLLQSVHSQQSTYMVKFPLEMKLFNATTIVRNLIVNHVQEQQPQRHLTFVKILQLSDL